MAEHFEVSIRTIHRDIETLSIAGIPIYTKQGKNGGVALMERYVFDKGILTETEQREIIAALQAMREVTMIKAPAVLDKLRAMFSVDQRDWVAIDFSDWSNQHKDLYFMIKTAIFNSQVMQFRYFNRYGTEKIRQVEPIQLWFKDKSWYLKSYCLDKMDFRYFKLSRIKGAILIDEHFQMKQYPCEELKPSEKRVIEKTPLTVLQINKRKAFQVYDLFEEHEIEQQEQGDYIVRINYPVDEWFYSMIMSFGPDARVLEPKNIKEEIINRHRIAYQHYY